MAIGGPFARSLGIEGSGLPLWIFDKPWSILHKCKGYDQLYGGQQKSYCLVVKWRDSQSNISLNACLLWLRLRAQHRPKQESLKLWDLQFSELMDRCHRNTSSYPLKRLLGITRLYRLKAKCYSHILWACNQLLPLAPRFFASEYGYHLLDSSVAPLYILWIILVSFFIFSI